VRETKPYHEKPHFAGEVFVMVCLTMLSLIIVDSLVQLASQHSVLGGYHWVTMRFLDFAISCAVLRQARLLQKALDK